MVFDEVFFELRCVNVDPVASREMILKILCSFLEMLLELFGVYGDGELKWYYGLKPLYLHLCGKMSVVKVEVGDEEKSDVIEKTETQVEAPGTSVTEIVSEIVVEGSQHVVDGIKMTLNQAIEPVGKGMIMIQEMIHRLSIDDDDKKSEVEVD
ncbi:Organic solute transporter Ost-alpha [Artemisia annua]|uniref:Organic solute transporter Ost-alpha n=1 Tax=Artemisia annua TaxID=35608 RepID=A0A2U1KJJ1_ARTAN|nr:Organic solute transporter Ost-alpha [Artemisia annua]